MTYISRSLLPPTDNLLAALAALRLGSFSAAAGELGLTHAAVSRRVAGVEAWAGVRLFTRHGRGVQATPDGQRILNRVAVALEQIELLGRSARVRGSMPTVRLALTASFARYWLLPRLAAIEGLPAEVRVEPVAALAPADLAGGEVDLAIRYGRGSWRVGQEHKLYDETLIPVVAPSFIGTRPTIAARDIACWPLLHGSDTINWRAWAARHGVKAGKAADRVFDGYALAIDAAQAGLGVALWNSALHRLPDGLVACTELPVASPLGYYLLRRAGDTDSPAARVAARLLAAR